MTTKKESQAAKKADKPKTRGRPTDYTEELGDLICEGIALGKSLARICEDEALPAPRTVYRWLRTHQEFCHNYEHAKEDQAEMRAEELLEIADDARNDYMDTMDDQGGVGYKLNGENIQRSRLRVDTRKWIASKFKPKKYGDRIFNENKDVSSFKDLSPEELKRKREELERELEASTRD